MSLNVYRCKEDVPKHIKVVDCNDAFFNVNTVLKDSELTRYIIEYIDRGHYCNEDFFYGRDNEVGLVRREALSTGSKTLLNIALHSDFCFNVIECGNNAINVLSMFHDGNIIWKYPVCQVNGIMCCDILYYNKHFLSFNEFLRYVRDTYEPEV